MMASGLKEVEQREEKEQIARSILSGLPEWFGLPDSMENYIQKSKDMPFWAYYIENVAIGFIALKETSEATAEIFVMGVQKDRHRQGVGECLYHALEQYAKESGYSFVQVKTVQMGKYEEYDRTNQFYMKMGFQELECFPTLWDEWNPCQIYVKSIQ